MILTDNTYIAYQEELEKISSIAAAFSRGVAGAKNLYARAVTSPIVQGANMGAAKGLGGMVGGATKGLGQSMKPTSTIGKKLKQYGDVVGEVAEQAAYKRGGIVKKPTVARLAEDGDPEAVIPLGNDKADIKNRKRVIKKALKVMEKEKKASDKKSKVKKMLPQTSYDGNSSFLSSSVNAAKQRRLKKLRSELNLVEKLAKFIGRKNFKVMKVLDEGTHKKA